MKPSTIREVYPYRLVSTKPWLRYPSKWERYRAMGKAMGLSREARTRLEWLLWYETTGQRNARATCRHFGIAPKVFYHWKGRFSETNLRSLEDRSHRPQRVRTRTITPTEEQRVIALRKAHLRYSKIKLTVLYQQAYGQPISSWKIQKVIERYRLYPNPQRAARTAVKRKRAQEKKRITELQARPHPGFLVALDTVVFWWQGTKRYLLTAVDRCSKLAFARLYTTHSSFQAADFLKRLQLLLDGRVVHVQTDNGSEFHKHFERAVQDLGLTHWWSRTHTPTDNAVCERFNRTIQDEFIAEGNAIPDLEQFHRKLLPWLEEYNFHRPHQALGYRTPIQAACPDPKAFPIYSSHTPS